MIWSAAEEVHQSLLDASSEDASFLREEGVKRRDTTGRYTLLERVGNGGMGDVYKARDEELQRIVAVKAVCSFFRERDVYRKRFERERLVMRALSHPSIARYYGALELESEEGEKVPAYARQYLTGQSLRTLIEKEPLPLSLIARTTIQVAHALHYVHGLGLVVRDIKADDIILETLVGEEGAREERAEEPSRAMLFDFGIVTRQHDADPKQDATAVQAYQRLVGHNYETITHPGVLMGSPGYMSPEHIEMRAVDGRTDLYALGVTLYYMLTRHHAFQGDTPTRLFNAILRDEPQPFINASPLDGICLRLLEKDRANRYQTGYDVVEAVLDAVPEMDAPIATTSGPTNGAPEPRTHGYMDELVRFLLTPAEWIFGDRNQQ